MNNMTLRSGKTISIENDYKTNYDKMVEFVSKCSSNNSEDKSINSPFFNAPATNIELNDLYSKSNLKTEYVEFMNKSEFPVKLKLLYLILGNENEELHYNSFIFMDIKTIKERYDIYNNLFDIGFIYRGMGHIMVLSMIKCKADNQLFFRFDGGSNGFEREINYNYFKDVEISNIEQSKYINFDTIYEFITEKDLHDLSFNFDFMKNYVIEVPNR
jgi:hypothetical protein